jgi:LysR family glycine cleavage system transcriptional activator
MQAPQRQGRVVVSVAPSFATKWLMPRLEAFQSRAPEIEVWVSADARLTDFTDGAVDLAIRYGPGSYEGLKAEKLLEEAVLPVCSPAIAATLKKPADLRGVSLLHDDSPDNDPSCPSWSMWLSARGVIGVDGTRGPRFNQGALVVEAAAHGRGVGLAKRAIADADLLSGRLVAPFADGAAPINFAYWLAWPKGRTLRPQVRTFISWLRAEAHLSEGAGV